MKVIAHRGASGYAPENTITAFKRALEQGCHAIELDVQLTKDGEIVVFHDWTLERTTNGFGEVKGKTLKELKELDAGSWFSKKFKGERIPTLGEVLEVVPKEVLLNIEVRSRYSEDSQTEEKVIELLERHNRSIDSVIISCFDHSVLKRISDKKKGIKLGLLLTGDFIEPNPYIINNKIELYSIQPARSFVSEETITTTSYKVYPWIVNEESEMENLKRLNVDGLVTNYPDIAVRKLA